jgi:hypothetical protein
MGRLGKIASLPLHLREELNGRLDDNEPGPDLLAWLNARPEARAMLKQPRFDGAPINDQNLTNWRQGGYSRWQQHQRDLDFARTFSEESAGLESVAGDVPLADRLAEHSVMALAGQLRAADAMPDGPEKVQTVLGVTHELSLLRRCNQGSQLLRMKTEDRAAEREQARETEVRVLVEQDLQAVEHESLEKFKAIWLARARCVATRERLRQEGKPVPKEVDEFLAASDEFARRMDAWRKEATSDAWSRTLSLCSLDALMRQTHKYLTEQGDEVDDELAVYVRLPEAERHESLRRTAAKAAAIPDAPAATGADQGNSR